MNPYQSPVPIEQETPPWLRVLLVVSREALFAALGFMALLSAALMLIVVMPVAIGLAWYQFRRSYALIDLFLASAMTFMLPLWQNALVVAWVDYLRGKM
jgi:hypothetical protein